MHQSDNMGSVLVAICAGLIVLNLSVVKTVSAGKASSSSKCEKSLTMASGSKAPPGKECSVHVM